MDDNITPYTNASNANKNIFVLDTDMDMEDVRSFNCKSL